MYIHMYTCIYIYVLQILAAGYCLHGQQDSEDQEKSQVQQKTFNITFPNLVGGMRVKRRMDIGSSSRSCCTMRKGPCMVRKIATRFGTTVLSLG